jgi:hypothetical protein
VALVFLDQFWLNGALKVNGTLKIYTDNLVFQPSFLQLNSAPRPIRRFQEDPSHYSSAQASLPHLEQWRVYWTIIHTPDDVILIETYSWTTNGYMNSNNSRSANAFYTLRAW